MKKVFENYTRAFLEGNENVLADLFSEDATYRECIGLEYIGREQIVQWFKDWHAAGTMLEWKIYQMVELDQMLVAEWYIKYDYEGEIGHYDAVSLIKFDDQLRMLEVKEFGSKPEHERPYRA